MTTSPNLARLESCGWASFRPELFLKEPGRAGRDVSVFFLNLLDEFVKGKTVLELCCGAGALLLSLAKAGYECVGVDLSSKMLKYFATELAKESVEIQERLRLVHDDMCSFSLDQQFDFIILEDECFQQLLTTDDQLACLSRVVDHLEERGYCFFNLKTPYQELRLRKEADHDPLNQVIKSPHRWDVVDTSGQVTVLAEGFECRKLIYPCEFDLLLRHAGLYPLHKWGDCNRTPFTDPETQEYHYLVTKNRD